MSLQGMIECRIFQFPTNWRGNMGRLIYLPRLKLAFGCVPSGPIKFPLKITLLGPGFHYLFFNNLKTMPSLLHQSLESISSKSILFSSYKAFWMPSYLVTQISVYTLKPQEILITVIVETWKCKSCNTIEKEVKANRQLFCSTIQIFYCFYFLPATITF